MTHIAVLDDDPEFCSLVKVLLTGAGYQAASFGTAGRLLDSLLKKKFDLLVVDVSLPGMNGRELVRVLKSNPETRRIPVIVVSGVAVRREDMVRGLNEGADEYLLKPLKKDLFLARVASLLRRTQGDGPEEGESELLISGALKMNLAERTAAAGSSPPLELTRLEFDVLEYFLRNPGRVLTRGVLLQTVWKQPPGVATRTVDKHVESLRKKLGSFGSWIQTVVNVGYVYRPGKG